MSMGLARSLHRRRIDVCDECGEDILDYFNDHYVGWILGRRWDLHKECFDKRRLDMDDDSPCAIHIWQRMATYGNCTTLPYVKFS
jgi:hypothetical protein